MKCALLAGAAVLAVLSTPVFAEDAAKDAAVDPATTGEIIVTAQHEKSKLSKTPISMSAVSGESLRSAGVLTAAALRDVAPSISIDHTDGLQITIRGVTSTDQTEKGDPSAAFMLDGVYIARTQAADVAFFDVDRVEVLRGPQGTLYGRNTTAGVVNVITNRPKLGVTEGYADAGAGNYNAYNVDAAFNLPISAIAALRVAGSYDRHDNYVKPEAGDVSPSQPQRENAAFRAQLLIQPTSELSILLRSDYANIKGMQLANYDQVPVTNFFASSGAAGTPVTWLGNSASTELQRGSTLAVEPGILGNHGGTQAGSNETSYALESEINYNFGILTATNLASYRHFARNDSQSYYLGAPTDFAASFNGTYAQFSDEFRVATNGTGPFKIQAGLYMFHEHEDIALYLFGLLGSAGNPGYVYGFPQNPVINRTKGAFTQATLKPVDSVRLTAGVRYTDDYKYRYGHTVSETVVGGAPSVGYPNYVNDAQIKSTKVTWRAGIDADVPTGLAYATISTGYKAGGFGDGCSTGGAGQSLISSEGERCDYSTLVNAALPLQTNKALPNYNPLKYGDTQAIYYKPETLTSYEIGYKGKFFDNKVRLNASAFYYNYANMQLSGAVDIGGAPSLVTTNAGKSSVKGIELESTIQPDTHNRLNLGLDLLDAHYTDYCAAYVTGTFVCNDQWSGRKLDHSPTRTFRASYDLTIPAGDGKVDAVVGTRLMSSYEVTAFYATPVQYTIPTHSTTDISLTYTAPGNRWYVQAYAKNLENFITVNGVNTFGGVTALGDPRTFGARAGFKF